MYIGGTPRSDEKLHSLKWCTAPNKGNPYFLYYKKSLIKNLYYYRPQGKATMPSYDYECKVCHKVLEVYHSMNDATKVRCPNGDGGEMTKVYLTPVATVVPPNMQAAGDKSKYYGVKNIYTGEGITKDTNVGSPPGIKVKSPKRS